MPKTIVGAALVCALAAAPGLVGAQMNRDAYNAEKSRIETQHRAAKDACNSMAGNAKDVCEEQAEGDEKVAKAELDYRRSGDPADRTKVAMVKAEAAYEVATEKCEDLAGNAKDVCEQQAKTERTKAEADVQTGKKTAEAVRENVEDKMSAEYKLAREKCDALAGDAKSACVDNAKRTYRQ